MEKQELSPRLFYALSHNMKHPEIPNSMVLTRFLLGHTSARLFEQLIIEMSRTRSPGRVLYKTDEQLGLEIAASAVTVKRYRPVLEESGFDITRTTINRKHSYEYRFNMERFQAFAAEKLGFTAEEIKAFMAGSTHGYDGWAFIA